MRPDSFKKSRDIRFSFPQTALRYATLRLKEVVFKLN